MNIALELDYDFEREFQNLRKQYDYEYTKITGFKPQQMNFITYIKQFVEAQNKNDNSVDGTSNSDKKDVVALLSDIDKPQLKLLAFNKIFSEIKEKYGLDEAKTWLKSEFLGFAYLHDAHMASLIPYCYAYDLKRLAEEGLFFISKMSPADLFDSNDDDFIQEPYNAEPAQHLDTFVNLIKEYVSWCCNRQSGAVGLPNIIPYLYYFWLKDIKEGYNGCYIQTDNEGKILLGIEDYPNIDNTNPNIKYFKQQIQALIYALNQPFLRGGIQSAFTNFSIFDHEYAHALFDGMTFPDGSLAYDHIDNIVEIQKIVMDVISAIRSKNMFTFPVLSYSLLTEKVNIDDNFDSHFKNKDYLEFAKNYCNNHPELTEFVKFKDEDFAMWASNHNTNWMDSNFFIDDKVTSLSNCCRLKSDISDLGYFNSIGGTALSVGSIKVNTVNLAKIAYKTLSNNVDTISPENNFSIFDTLENNYIENLKRQVIINLKCLDVIRDIMIKNIKKGLLPNIDDGLIDLKHMYNTVGFIGVYETLRAYQNKIDKINDSFGCKFVPAEYDYITIDAFGNNYYTKRAENFVERIFNTMQDTFKEFKTEYNIQYSINCEQIPGETAADKLKKKDTLTYPDLVVDDLPTYGNQFLPLGIKATIDERVRVAALFDKFCNGGSICHLNFEGQMTEETAWEKLNWLAQQGLTYSAFTTKINVCRHNHAFFTNKCPECQKNGESGDIYTQYARIVGFYVPICTWSESRKKEYKLRQWE